MARLGKAVKGKSKAAQNAGKSQIKKSLEDVQEKLDEDTIARMKADALRKEMKDRLKLEKELSLNNKKKIDEIWRQTMRLASIESLRKEIEMLSQIHERNVDRKDAIIQMIERDLEESDEQYLIALRKHFSYMDKLIEIQDSRLLSLESAFQSNLKQLEMEFANERHYMESLHLKEVTDLKDLMAAVDEVEKNKELKEKHEFGGNRDDVRNKNTEELNILKNTLESMITKIEQDFEANHENYLSKTDSRTQEFKRLTLEDQNKSKEIEMRIRKLDRLQNNINHWKFKMKSNSRTCEERNELLRNEINLIVSHYKELKNRMNEFRAIQNHRLKELTKSARMTNETLSTFENKLKNLLLLAEQARKLETEREKVLPFYNSTVEDEEVAKVATEYEKDEILKDDEIELPSSNETESKPLTASFVTQSGKKVHEFNALDTYFKKYNKVLVDELSIERERNRLIDENNELRNLLKRYLDGVTVNDDVINNDNPLFVINGKTNARVVPMANNATTIQEGNMIVNNNRIK